MISDEVHCSSIGLLLLVPHGRSGSVLYQTLFDEHPEVAVMPKLFSSYPLVSLKNGFENAVDRFIADMFDLWSLKLGYFGEQAPETKWIFKDESNKHRDVSPELFKRLMLNLLARQTQPSESDFLICAHLAYRKALDPAFDHLRVRWVLFHLHGYSAGVISRISHDFRHREIRLLAPIRDPRELFLTYKSRARDWRGGKDNEAFGEAYYYMQDFHNCAKGLGEAITILGGNAVKMVDFNSAHGAGYETMKALADWLGIGFSDSLMKTTINGVTWLGNRTDGKSAVSFDDTRSQFRFYSALSLDDRIFVEALTANIIFALGYPQTAGVKLSRLQMMCLLFRFGVVSNTIVHENGRPESGWWASEMQAWYVRHIKRIASTGSPLRKAKLAMRAMGSLLLGSLRLSRRLIVRSLYCRSLLRLNWILNADRRWKGYSLKEYFILPEQRIYCCANKLIASSKDSVRVK